jgi:hypothetical protein
MKEGKNMKVINYAFESYFDFMIQALNSETGLRTDITFKNLKRYQWEGIKQLIENSFWGEKEFTFNDIDKIMRSEENESIYY